MVNTSAPGHIGGTDVGLGCNNNLPGVTGSCWILQRPSQVPVCGLFSL